uniref:Ycf80 n=1 Tax=Rhodomela confervoides TaxID=35163 RepID=A0A1Z1M9J9_RHOCN|nr:hypothetical protein [Rhodomela confervoides]ARW62656.1 hypothetical protein [Rhodomela confervoides]
MILSNFILFYKVLKNYRGNKQYLALTLNQSRENSKNMFNLKSNRSPCIFISNSKSFTDQVSSKSLKNKNDNKLITRNFWQTLVNKYIKEIIYLSPSNSLSESYINKLKTIGLSVYKGNEYKSFLQRFSKDLLNGNIQILTNVKDRSSISLLNRNDVIYLKYNWLKFLNFNLLNSKKIIHNVYNESKYNETNIAHQSLPIFILINSNNEIVLSESPDQLRKSNDLFNLSIQSLGKVSSTKKLYTGLVFINPSDALEYKEYINAKYSSSTRLNQIRIMPVTINLYFQLMNLRKRNVEFRLIPDLKELSDLVYKYRKYQYLSLDSNQNYGHNYFQGQPVYLIKSIRAKSRKNKDLKVFNYLYSSDKKKNLSQYEAVFFSYETAMDAWKKFVEENKDYHLPVRPSIYVSNLEKFIKTSYYKKNHSKIIFLPSIDTYKFLKRYLQSNIQNKSNINYWMTNRIVYIRTLCYRVFWSLTSRQPMNW